MKLAEALIIRADLQNKISEMKGRISSNVLIQEGEEVAEDPNILIDELSILANELNDLIFRINKTNLTGKTGLNRLLTEAIAEKESLKITLSIFNNAYEATVKKHHRYNLKEIRWVKAIDLLDLQKKIDNISKQLRLTNVEIQTANWLIDLE